MDSSSSGDRGRLLQVPYNHQDLIRLLLVGMREGVRVQFGGQPDEWPAEAPAPRRVIDARRHPAWPGELARPACPYPSLAEPGKGGVR